MRNQKGIAAIMSITIAVVAAVILFAPIPEYRKGPFLCKAGGHCPQEGWYLGPSLFQKFKSRLGFGTKFPLEQEPAAQVAPSSPTDQVENWKTYTNQEFGFSFSFPSDLNYKELDERKQGGSFFVELNSPYTLNISIGKNTLDIGQFIQTTFCDQNICASLKDTESIIIDGKPARRLKPPAPIDSEAVVFKNGDYIYKISTVYNQQFQSENSKEIYNNEQKKELLNKIISNFKFLNQTDETADWKTYESKKIGYSFMYPPELEQKELDWGVLLWKPTDRKVFMNLRIQSKAFPEPVAEKQKITISWINADGSLSNNDVLFDLVKQEKTERIDSLGTSVRQYWLACGTDCGYYMALFQNGDTYYELILDAPGGQSPYQINQILSTFKFIN